MKLTLSWNCHSIVCELASSGAPPHTRLSGLWLVPAADRVVEVIVQTIAGPSQHVAVHGGPFGGHAGSPASQTPALTHWPMDTRLQGVGPGPR